MSSELRIIQQHNDYLKQPRSDSGLKAVPRVRAKAAATAGQGTRSVRAQAAALVVFLRKRNPPFLAAKGSE